MDPILYFRIYKEGVDELVILKYIGYTEASHFLSIIKDHV